MFTKPLILPYNEKSYVNGRATPYDPCDPHSKVFFPVSVQNIKEDIEYYKNKMFDQADMWTGDLVDNDKVDFELEDDLPSDARVYIVADIEDKHPTMKLITIPAAGDLQASLAVDQQFVQSWFQPVLYPPYGKKRSRSYIIELNPKKFKSHEFFEAQERLKSSLAQCSSFMLNSPNMAFSVQTIKIPKKVYDLIVECGCGNGRSSRGRVSIPFNYASHKESELVEIPVLFTLTDGASLFIDFRVDVTWEKSPKNGYDSQINVGLHDIPQDILTFWNDLPHLFSNHADSSIQCLTGFIKDVYNCDVSLKVFDIAGLAVMVGCKLDDYSLCALHIVVFGTGFPDFTENMDNKWALAETPVYMDEFKEKKLFQISNMFSIFSGHMLRTYFPDPDSVLSTLNMTQFQFIGWFTGGLGESLVGGDVTKIEKGMTRIQMIRSMNPDSKLLGAFAELCISVPCLGAGGARFLHSTIRMFISQYYVIRGIVANKLISVNHRRSPDVTKDIQKKEAVLLFGRSFQTEDDSGSPAVDGLHGLQANPQFSWDLFEFNPKYDDILKIIPQINGRLFNLTFAEWARLNLSLVRVLLDKLNSVEGTALHPYWTSRLPLYTRIRNMLENVRSEQQYVETLEFSLTANRENVSEDMEVHEKELRIQERRLESLKAVAAPDHPLNQGLQQAVYEQLPGLNTADNNKKGKRRDNLRKMAAAAKGEPYISRRYQRKQRQLALLQSRSGVAKKAHIPGVEISKPSSASSSSKGVSFSSEVKNFDGSNKGAGWKHNRNRKGKKSVVDLRLKLDRLVPQQ